MAHMSKYTAKDGRASWRIRWRYGGTREGAWQGTTIHNHEQAKQFKAIVESRRHRVRDDAPEVQDLSILTGQPSAPSGGGLTFAEVAEQYITSRTRAGAASRYVRASLRGPLADLLPLPIADITSADVVAMVNQRTEAGKSAVVAFDLLRSVMKYATTTEPPLRRATRAPGSGCRGLASAPRPS